MGVGVSVCEEGKEQKVGKNLPTSSPHLLAFYFFIISSSVPTKTQKVIELKVSSELLNFSLPLL